MQEDSASRARRPHEATHVNPVPRNGYEPGRDDRSGPMPVAYMHERTAHRPEAVVYCLHVDADMYLRIVWTENWEMRAGFARRAELKADAGLN